MFLVLLLQEQYRLAFYQEDKSSMKKIIITLVVLFYFSPAYAATITPVPALNFTQSIGVNTHIGEAIGFYRPDNFPAVESALEYLGVFFIRDQFSYSSFCTYYQQISTATGLKFDMIMTPDGDSYASKLPCIQQNTNIFHSIEGCNEIDNFPFCNWNSLTGLAGARAFQYQLLTDISPLSIPLWTLTDETKSDYYTIGPLPANSFSLHSYNQYGVESGSTDYTAYSYMNAVIVFYPTLAPGRSTVITETGGWTTPCSDGWTQNVQAKYILNSIFDSWILGNSAVSIYEASDDFNDPSCNTNEDHFGLLDYQGSPKVSGTTIHNMTILLTDSSTIAPASIAYTFSGMPINGHSLLLQKTDGTYWLAIWNDAQIWNFNTSSEITVAPVSVILNLTSVTASTINVYDPFINTSIQQTSNNTNSINISVPDHVILVNIRP